MLRLFTNRGFYELCKCSQFVVRRQVIESLPFSSVSYHQASILTRRFSTGSPVWNDAFEPKSNKPNETETVDLDKWKSVMRSKAGIEEKQKDGDEEEARDDDESLTEAGGDSSSLEACRNLVEMWRLAGRVVPQEITDEQLQMLAGLTTKTSRKKYLKFLAIKEHHKRANKEKQQQKKAEREAALEQKRADAENEDNQREQELKRTFLPTFWNRSLDKLLAWRSAQAMVFGQPLVFDMSYGSHMSRHEMSSAVSQMMEAEGWNRRATEPYHLYFCNLQPDGVYMQELLKRYGAETWDRLLITSTDRQHVDLFPREQLIYLTADSPNVLRTFDHSKVYIIGAIVDRSPKSGLSLASAKRLKLATARLPLDHFLHWDIGAKNLTLDQMLRILLTIKDTGKWEEALKFVPSRKHSGFHQEHRQKNIANNRVRGLGNLRPTEYGNGALGSGKKISERTFTNVESGDRGNKPPATRVRTSLKSNIEARKNAGRRKMWWDDE
uniref:tRNA methyltransferase 10 homolog C n=1 Tax=Monopterus albus TaxID=43700 RepID=A0A3Q3K521_MONAL|nr:mitochondrial ribonuclease P protein 1 [Monopterus albus]